jgi:microcystin-dependent protein
MSEPFIGEIKLVSFNYPPRGWALCNGQTLSIAQNQALFSLLGTTYGGDGVQTFQLPNYQARMPMHFGNGYSQGQAAGEPAHTLILNEIPSHNHQAVGVTTNATSASASANAWASSGHNPYAASPHTLMNGAALANTGGSQSHDNMAPYLTLNFVIALVGIFPSRN